MTLSKLYHFWDGKAWLSHLLIGALVTFAGSLVTVGYEAMIGISSAYFWQETRQAAFEQMDGKPVRWKAHLTQAGYPLVVSVVVYWIFR